LTLEKAGWRLRFASAVGSARIRSAVAPLKLSQPGQNARPCSPIFPTGTNVSAVPPCDHKRPPNANEYEKHAEKHRPQATHAQVPDAKADKTQTKYDTPNRAECIGKLGVRAFPFSRIIGKMSSLLDLPSLIDQSQFVFQALPGKLSAWSMSTSGVA
jgi:hypothetical protein